ncbi:hypothetical protein B0T21DRAFT_27335 [Apiosordaria backusii]|uniref:Secreted protein n=1 Tax=Apiosordaria backusii TaxID=314023 RepID=A0AA40K7D9_9PEZI|nr:hypothetical protein B0T21DRAFT_27335 [Apiosordaria backusii]
MLFGFSSLFSLFLWAWLPNAAKSIIFFSGFDLWGRRCSFQSTFVGSPPVFRPSQSTHAKQPVRLTARKVGGCVGMGGCMAPVQFSTSKLFLVIHACLHADPCDTDHESSW